MVLTIFIKVCKPHQIYIQACVTCMLGCALFARLLITMLFSFQVEQFVTRNQRDNLSYAGNVAEKREKKERISGRLIDTAEWFDYVCCEECRAAGECGALAAQRINGAGAVEQELMVSNNALKMFIVGSFIILMFLLFIQRWTVSTKGNEDRQFISIMYDLK